MEEGHNHHIHNELVQKASKIAEFVPPENMQYVILLSTQTQKRHFCKKRRCRSLSIVIS